MIEADARAQLERMVAHDSDPQLTAPEIDALLNFCKVSDTGWALDLGAAEGWRWKAGKVAALYSFAIDNQRSEQGQVYANCIIQSERYDRKTGNLTVLRIVAPYAETLSTEGDPA